MLLVSLTTSAISLFSHLLTGLLSSKRTISSLIALLRLDSVESQRNDFKSHLCLCIRRQAIKAPSYRTSSAFDTHRRTARCAIPARISAESQACSCDRSLFSSQQASRIPLSDPSSGRRCTNFKLCGPRLRLSGHTLSRHWYQLRRNLHNPALLCDSDLRSAVSAVRTPLAYVTLHRHDEGVQLLQPRPEQGERLHLICRL